MSEIIVALPSALAAALDSRVHEGGYMDGSDYVRDLLRRDLAEGAEDRRWLRAMITEGLASGVIDCDAEDVLAEVMEEDPDLRG